MARYVFNVRDSCRATVHWLRRPNWMIASILALSLAIVVCGQANAQSSSTTTLLQGFPKTAFDAWRDYYNRFDVVGVEANIEFTSTSAKDELEPRVTTWYKKGDLFVSDQNGSNYAIAVNAKYSFTVSNRKTGKPRITDLSLTPKPVPVRQRTATTFGSYLGFCVIPGSWESLLWFEKIGATFRVTNTTVDAANPALVHVEFEIKPSQSGFPESGQMTLDSSKFWLPTKMAFDLPTIQLSEQDAKAFSAMASQQAGESVEIAAGDLGPTGISAVWSYAAINGRPFVDRFEIENPGGGISPGYPPLVASNIKYRFDAPSESRFRLSYYGFSEPDGVLWGWPKWLRYSLFGAIILLLGFGIQRIIARGKK